MKNKILIVDDDPTSLRSVKTVLESQGYEVRAALDAEDIELKAEDFNPQLIVMDLMMPDVDGSQAVGRLQKNPLLSRIPVIFLTAIQMKDEERGLEAEINVGSKGYRTLTKPVDAKLLVAEIERLIK